MDSRALSELIAKAIVRSGTDRLFGMPGGGNNLNLIAAARAAGVQFVLGHHETSATIMASVYGDLTGTPGVCVVTRGPGAANAVNGAANAQLDRQALVLITDTVSAEEAERVAHQRLDQRALFAPVTQWSATVGGHGDNADAAAVATAEHAFTAAQGPRPGAVHLDFDPSAESTPIPPPNEPIGVSPAVSPTTTNDGAVQHALDLVAGAERPVFVLGVGARDHADALRAALSESHAPVLMTYRAKGVIPDSWPSNAGLMTGATTEAPVLDAADLIVFVGVDTVEFIPSDWGYAAPVVSFSEWPDDTTFVRPEAEVIGDLNELVPQLGEVLQKRASILATTQSQSTAQPQHPNNDANTPWPPSFARDHRTAELRAFEAAGKNPDSFTPQEVVSRARAASPEGTIATIDAGAHMFPATVLWHVERPDEMLISSGLATMGFALPAAIAAALARPGRRVVCFTGDGGLGMCLGDLETLVRLGLNVTVVVFNDAALSLIDIKAIPGDDPERDAVSYLPTDFAKVAAGYGLRGHLASSGAEFEAAFRQSLEHGGPSLIDAQIDPSGYPQIMHAIRGQREDWFRRVDAAG